MAATIRLPGAEREWNLRQVEDFVEFVFPQANGLAHFIHVARPVINLSYRTERASDMVEHPLNDVRRHPQFSQAGREGPS